ncbi:D-alanyl-D-alanine carboxypeptidase family protein [Natronospora cellulosivora (SeqCode)]
MFKKLILSFILIFILFSTSIIASQDLELDSKSAILMEYETGEIIFQKEADTQLPPASMTKIMTMLLVMEAVEEGRATLEDKIVVSELAASMGGSQIWLEPGEEMTLENMMKAIAIVSANDACVAVAEYLYGTEQAFVKRMNERAKELGLKNTFFYNTNGLPSEDEDIQGNYTTARDLAIMGRELIKHKKVLEWTSTWMDYLRNGESVLNNTNRLVRFYKGADGLKTGYTEEARFCLTSTATRGGLRFIAVVMGNDNSQDRFEEAGALLTYGFGMYQGFEAAQKGDLVQELNIINAEDQFARAIIEGEVIIPIKRGSEDEIIKEIVLQEKIIAPLSMGDKIGEVRIYKGDTLVKTEDVIIDRDVNKASFFQIILRIINLIINSIFNIFARA